jgi:hypothetical protein
MSCAKEFDPPAWAAFPITALTMTDRLNTTNAGPFLGWRAGSVKLTDYGMEPFKGADGKQWHRFRVEFLIRLFNAPDTQEIIDWKERRMIQGSLFKNETKTGGVTRTTYDQIVDKQGHPVNRPVPITAGGAIIDPGGKPEWELWKIYKSSDFNVLGITAA